MEGSALERIFSHIPGPPLGGPAHFPIAIAAEESFFIATSFICRSILLAREQKEGRNQTLARESRDLPEI